MVEGTLELITEEKVRSALGRTFSSYDSFNIEDHWQSGHAYFGRVVLSKGKKSSAKHVKLVAKAFIHPTECFDPSYVTLHDPGLLFHNETVNLQWISRILSSQKEKPRLYPLFHGSSDIYRLLVTEDLGSENKKRELVAAIRNGGANLEDIFIEGIKTAARFVGRCNAHSAEFNATGIYHEGTDTQRAADLALLTENVARSFYNAVQTRTEEQRPAELKSGDYDSERVLDYLRREKKLDLKARLKEIQEMKKSLHAEMVFQHNDCNGLNIVGSTLVDFEKFGLDSWTSDISSYCIIVGVGNNAILRADNFSHFRHIYLAYENAFRTDPEKAKLLDEYKNGQFRKFVSEVMVEQRYTDWTMSFFADAICKNLQLSATYSRYGPSQKGAATGLDADSIKCCAVEDITEIFSTVAGLNHYFSHCTDPEGVGVRNYFHTFGKLLYELGLYSGQKGKTRFESALQEIKGDTIAGNVAEEWPYPK